MDHLLPFLSENDAPCPACGYNLRGVAAPTCPECAAPLHLAVASVNTSLGPWLLAVIACALALGFDAVVTLLLTVGNTASFINGSPDLGALLLLACFFTLTLACAVALVITLRHRRPWVLMPRRRQWITGWSVFAAVGLAHAAFAATIMILA